MPGYAKVELRRVTQWKDDAVYRTTHVRFEWFELGTGPDLYTLNDDGEMWVATNDCYFGPSKPG